VKIEKNELKTGFTLIELLVVMAILSILSLVGFGQYQTSQKKARDAQRKADLSNIARAFSMYYNDHQEYPLAVNGLISIDGSVGLNWDDSFEDDNSIYMKKLPKDPVSNFDYCYYRPDDDGNVYSLFSKIENSYDSDYRKDCNEGECYVCNLTNYDYVYLSSNAEATCQTCL